jgi:hypothetical protein
MFHQAARPDNDLHPTPLLHASHESCPGARVLPGIRLKNMKPLLIVRRYPYEEPYHTQLEFVVSKGNFAGGTDIYCNVEDLKETGKALQNFPAQIGDEYRYEYGSENPEDRCYRYFLMRAYTTDGVGHCAVQFVINQNSVEPDEGVCRFSISADAASINRLGILFEKFHELRHLEFHWSPDEAELFEDYQLEASA